MKGTHVKERATDQDKLQQKFKAFQQEWESYKQSSPTTHRRYCSTDSNAMANKSSLQHRLSPSEGGWKIRINVLAMEEILGERMAVVESGRLEGRQRLFEALEDETEMGFGIESGGNKDLPVCFHASSSSVSSLCGEQVGGEVLEEEKMVVAASMETRRVAYGGSGNRRRRMVISLTGWLVIALIFVYAICIVPVRSSSGDGDEHEMFLVPTSNFSLHYHNLILNLFFGGVLIY